MVGGGVVGGCGCVVGGDGVVSGLLVDYGVESVGVGGGVFDGPLATVGLDEGVGSVDYVAVPGLLLALDVTGVGVVDVVVELVGGVGVRVVFLVAVVGGHRGDVAVAVLGDRR